jgi:5-methylcytosine-specific restriction endonuclease McrBC GTP-binding regulatory subunit McrB
MSSEDKSLGAWFVTQKITKAHFGNKVLKYLWDDAFKFDRASFFNTDMFKTLDRLLDRFDSNGFTDILADIPETREIIEQAKSKTIVTLNEELETTNQLGGDENGSNEN